VEKSSVEIERGADRVGEGSLLCLEQHADLCSEDVLGIVVMFCRNSRPRVRRGRWRYRRHLAGEPADRRGGWARPVTVGQVWRTSSRVRPLPAGPCRVARHGSGASGQIVGLAAACSASRRAPGPGPWRARISASRAARTRRRSRSSARGNHRRLGCVRRRHRRSHRRTRRGHPGGALQSACSSHYGSIMVPMPA